MADITPISYPLINGFRHQFSSVELKFQVEGGQKVQIFMKSLNYSRKRNRGLVRGNHPDPVAKTRGENEYSADCELFLSEWLLLKRTLSGSGGGGYGDVFFTAMVTYGENGFDTFTDQIQGCTMDGVESSMSQGSDPLVRKFDLAPLKIIFDDEDDLEFSLSAPVGQ